jgi:hypothetical protein
MDQAEQFAALQQQNVALQQQQQQLLLQMAQGQAPGNNMIQRVMLDKLRNLKWREHDKDGNIIDTVQQFERITAMDPLMPDHEKRSLLIGVFENPAALTIDAALADADLAQQVATYQDLKQYVLNSFERLLALQAQIPSTEMGQQMFINCLVNALHRAGKHNLAADVMRAAPATLAQAINRACMFDYAPPGSAATTSNAAPTPSIADPAPSSAGPTPMELGAMPTAGAVIPGLTPEQLTPLVASITQQTIEATFAALGIRGGFDGPGRDGSSGSWQSKARQSNWRDRGSSDWYQRSQSRDSRSRSTDRSDRDPCMAKLQ